MKTISTIIILFSLSLIPQKDYSQTNKEMDTILQNRFQEKLDEYIKAKLFILKNEKVYIEDIIKTKSDALEFSKNIFRLKYPKYNETEKLNFIVGDDKTKKLWFIHISTPYPTYGGEIYLIVVKNNCKIAYFEITK